jgi:hypothetical protein
LEAELETLIEGRSLLPAHKTVRRQRGSALSEFAPALFLIIIIGLFPVLDAIAMGIDYAAIFYLNELQLRDAQKLPRSQATALSGRIIAEIPIEWQATMLAALYDRDKALTTAVDYQPVPWTPVGANQSINFWFVTVSTTVSFRPFLAIPFFHGIPGLNAPYTLTVSGRRPVENNRFLNE